ncbi:MAG: type II toxin-antitoxin system VapC family toxin [Candidatus Diapherotrites archaeon]|nr:type II toxin-antitoxin system VapC family toxin [Candidatus Diapherotrites archaeon]
MTRLKYLDTSVLLESFIKNAPRKADCIGIISAVTQGQEKVLLSTLNIGELFHILLNRENLSIDYINNYLERTIHLPGVELVELDDLILTQGFKISSKCQIDLADACAIAIMQKHKLKYIYSLDSNFDKFPEILRLTELKV